jgi:group I intron endonuclease
MYTVYKHTTPSGKVYIGATGQNPKRRWDNGKGYRHNRRFCDAIRKYGWGNIEHEVISTGLDKEQAYAMEAELIDKYDTTNPAKGYNISIGGEYGGLGRSHSSETRRKISEALRGANNPNFGKHHSAETRRKISEAKCKKVVCVETGEVYRSLSAASKAAGVSLNAISNALCGESKTSGGYHWTYAK